MKTIEELNNNITLIVNNLVDDMEFQKQLTREYVNKSLNTRTIDRLFEGNMDTEDMELMEKICFCIVGYRYGYDILDPKKYFNNATLQEYDTYMVQDTDVITELKLDHVRKINAKEYSGYITLRELYLLVKNRLLVYNKNIQRASRLVRLSNGMTVKKTWLNNKGVKEIKERLIKGDLFTTNITFAVILKKNKTPLYRFNSNDGTTGDLIVKPIFDLDSENYAPLNCIDGWHRTTAGRMAYEEIMEKGEELKGGFNVSIFFMTEEEAKQYVADVFKRNETDTDFVKALENNDYTKAARKIIQKSSILMNNYAYNYKEAKKLNKLTSITAIETAIRNTDIPVENEIKSEVVTGDISKIIDLIVTEISTRAYNGNIEEMKKGNLLKINSFIGYVVLANELIKEENYITKLNDLIDKIIRYENEGKFNDLKLESTKQGISNIIERFKELL